jgi:hypothetical protein
MLVEFRVANHRSILDEQALVMRAAGGGADPADPTPRALGGERLLPVAAIYGANASGKSNMLSALAFMASAVIDSHPRWDPLGGVPRDPFAWGRGRAEPSLFEVTLALPEGRVQYGFVVDDQQVLEEWLFVWPKSRKQSWFKRDATGVSFGDRFTDAQRIGPLPARPNSLLLSAAVQNGSPQLAPIYRWFRSLRTDCPVTQGGAELGSSFRHVRRMVSDLSHAASFDPQDEDKLQQVADLLSVADTGIQRLRAEVVAPREPKGARQLRFWALHAGASDAWLPLEQESDGTQALFHLGLVMLPALRDGGVVVLDELGHGLHPLLASQLVQRFNDPATNPKGAQLLFSTHDTALLHGEGERPLLRRDQIWLAEKDQQGATTLTPLSRYKPRAGENLAKGYLRGRFGGVPYLGGLTAAAG